MKRVLCLAILFWGFVTLYSQQVQTFTSGEKTRLFVIIPFEYFIWTADNNMAQYELNVSINDSHKKIVYQNVFDIILDKTKILSGAALLKDISLALDAGTYNVHTQLRNPELGDKKESKHEFRVVYHTTPAEVTLIIGNNGTYSFMPTDYKQLTKDLHSADLLLTVTPEIDSLALDIETDTGLRSIILHSNTDIVYDLMPILRSGPVHHISLRYFSANIIYKSDTMLNQKQFQYNRKYSLQDQLQQIRYIANQNEWKKIKQTPDDRLEVKIAEFWDLHNSYPGQQYNLSRDAFYERVIKADELFTIHKKLNGWKSDRGRIYIKNGPPDEIISDIYPSGRYPYIKWYYYRDYKVFVFIDKSGYGNYKLSEEENDD